MKKFLVQAILLDGSLETVIDSIRTDNYETTLDNVMKRHRRSRSYLYVVMRCDTHEIVVKTMHNKFFL